MKKTGPIVKAGFTLLECCIVITACIITLAITWGNFSQLQTCLVRTDLDLLCTVCHAAQQRALSTHQQQIIQLDIAQNSFSYRGCTYTLSACVRFGVKKGLQGPPASPHHAITHPCTFAQNRIVFSPHGVMASGSVYLTDHTQTVAYALSNAVSEVSALRLYRYSSGAWQVLS